MTTNLSTQPYKGTRDFYPADMRFRQWMFARMQKVMKRFGYLEYDGPMLEPFELYAAKTNEEIVNEQLYWLTDRAERKLAIRPEMTPTLSRMIARKQNELALPIRWFSIPNLYRYERPQRGRLREHWQLNVDIFGGTPAEGDPAGCKPIAEDAEICQVIVALMAEFKATDGYEVRLNHRGLTNFIFKDLLKLEDQQIVPVGRLLDSAPKMKTDEFEKGLQSNGLSHKQIEFLRNLLNPTAGEQLKKDLTPCPHYAYLQNLLKQLTTLGVSKFFRYDPSIMRGFLYYTGMVLEVYDLHPDNNRALFGGGRYDNLIAMFGGKPLSGVGFGMGDVTLEHFLTVHQLLPKLDEPKGIYIVYLEDDLLIQAQVFAQKIRQQIPQLPVLTSTQAEKPKKAFSTAEKLNVQFILFVGPDDVCTNKFPMKDLVGKQQIQGSESEIIEQIKQRVV